MPFAMTGQISRTISPRGMDGHPPLPVHRTRKHCSDYASGEHPWDMGSPTRGQNVSLVINESLVCRQDASCASRPTCVNLLPCIKLNVRLHVWCTGHSQLTNRLPRAGGVSVGLLSSCALVSEGCASYESAVMMLRESDSENRTGWNCI